MTAKKKPADLLPRSVPTSSAERAELRAKLAALGITAPPSVNGATLRKLYANARAEIVTAVRDAEHAEALRIDELFEVDAKLQREAASAPAPAPRKHYSPRASKSAEELTAIALRAVETRRRNNAQREAARQAVSA